MKILKPIQCALLLMLIMHHDALASRADNEAAYAVFRVIKRHSFPKKEPVDMVSEIKSVAEKMKFDWSKVILHSSGEGIKDLYIVIKADDSKDLEKLKSDFAQILLTYVADHSVVVQDIEDLHAANRNPEKSK